MTSSPGQAVDFHPCCHPLSQAHTLLIAAAAIRDRAVSHGSYQPLDPAQRGALAAAMARITGWAQLHLDPSNLPGTGHSTVAGRMDNAASRLRTTRAHLETLTRGTPCTPHPVLDTVTDAAYATETAWIMTATVDGYPQPHHVHQVVTWLGNITRSLAAICDATSKEREPADENWWQTATLLTHAFHTIHAIAQAE